MGLLDRLLGPPSPDRFARMVIERLLNAGDPRQAEFDPAKFQIRFTSEGHNAGLVNLSNFYEEHCRIPRAARAKHLKHIIRGLLAYLKPAPEDYDDVLPDLRPIVRSRSYFEFLRLQSVLNGHAAPQIPVHDIGDYLSAAVVYDLPESMQTITRPQLEDWGVSYFEAFEAATHNLGEEEFVLAQVGENVYLTATGDNYDATRLLLVESFHQLDLPGQPVAMVPNRDTLLLTGSEDPAGLQLLAEIAEHAFTGPRPMSPVPLILDRGEWVTWLPDVDHPGHRRLRALEVKGQFSEYHEQKSLLDEIHQLQNSSTRVEPYSVYEATGGELLSYCTWSPGEKQWLPQTELLALHSEDGKQLYGGSWDRVQEIVGPLLQPVADTYPPRFEFRGPPTAAQLERIGTLNLG